MAEQGMESTRNEALRTSFSEFSHWSRLQALSMRIENGPKVEWSPEALDSFTACQAAEAGPEDFVRAAAFMQSEWAPSPARQKLAGDLSMLMALAAPGPSGAYDLHHPLAGTAMRAPNPMEGTPYAQKRAPALRGWRAREDGEPEIDSWASARAPGRAEEAPSAADMLAFKASVALEGGADFLALEEIAAEAAASAMGPAALAAGAALERRAQMAMSARARRGSGGFLDLGAVQGGGSTLRHFVHLANLRVLVACCDAPGLKGLKALASAVGEARSEKDRPRRLGPELGWLWSVDPASGMAWDEHGAKDLSREAAKARSRLKSKAPAGVQVDGWRQQRAIDMALAALEPWILEGRGVPDREERKKEIERALSYGKKTGHDVEWFIAACVRRSLRPILAELSDRPEHAGSAHPHVAEVSLGRRSQVELENLENLATLGGRPDEVWRVPGIAACKEAREAAGKAKALRAKLGQPDVAEALWSAGFALEGAAEPLAKEALAIASAREQRWASDHGLADAAARLEAGEGAKVKVEDLEAECARRRVSRASSPAAKLWAALEALWTEGEIRGDAARKASRRSLALMGWGASELDAFAKEPACEVFLGAVEKALEAKAMLLMEWSGEAKRPGTLVPKIPLSLSLPGRALLAAGMEAAKACGPDPAWSGSDPLAPAKLAKAMLAMGTPVWTDRIERLPMFAAPGMLVFLARPPQPSDGAEQGVQAPSAPMGPVKLFAKVSKWMQEEAKFEENAGVSAADLDKRRSPGEGFELLASRAKEVKAQAQAACKACYDLALGRSGQAAETFAEAKPEEGSKPAQDLMALACMGVAYWDPARKLPFAWEGEADFRMSAEKVAAREALGPAYPMVVEEGFVGAMAAMAAKAGRVPQFKEGADARSQANAWLAEGKRAARDWLGLTDSSMKMAADFGSAGEEMMELALGSAKVEAQAKFGDRSQAGAFGGAKSSARIFAMAAGRGLGAIPALAAIEAMKAWGPKLNKVGSREWMSKALAPVAEGMALGDALFEMGKEQRAKGERSERFEAALLERAGELVAKSNATRDADGKPRMAAGEAGKALAAEVSDMADWANDWVGRFWAQLPEKFGWKDLARGSKRWHDEQLAKSAASGEAWEPLGLSWSDEALEMSAVELTSPTALSEEGKAMRHCVGNYSDNCRNGSSRIFSIRKNGARLTTLELKPPEGALVEGGFLEPVLGAWTVKQHKGVCNCSPTPEALSAQAGIVEAMQALWAAKVEQERVKREKAAKAALSSAPKEGPQMGFDLEMDLPGFDAADEGRKKLLLSELAAAAAKPVKAKAKR